MFKNQRVDALAEQAQAAYESGAPVFVAAIFHRATNPGASVALDKWAGAIAEIEAAGWQLAHWTVGNVAHDAPVAYPVFRRR